jgi:peptidyl-prolyl cis-trans isomerase A (cyclophilin A)
MRILTTVLLLLLDGIVEVANSETSTVQCETTKGSFTIQVTPEWAPLGAQRFLDLVRNGFYTDIAMYRCVKGFLTQFGISDRKEMGHWHFKQIQDDPNLNLGIHKHYVSFAGGGPNTRSTQIFIAFEDLDFLGKEPWETPFGQVVAGHDTLNKLHKGYGEIHPFNKDGPNQNKIFNRGNEYIRTEFPLIDFIRSCVEIGGGPKPKPPAPAQEQLSAPGLIERDNIEDREEHEELNDENEGGMSKRKEPKLLGIEDDDDDQTSEAESEERMKAAPPKRIKGAASTVLPLYVAFIGVVLAALLVLYRVAIWRATDRSKKT